METRWVGAGWVTPPSVHGELISENSLSSTGTLRPIVELLHSKPPRCVAPSVTEEGAGLRRVP